MKVELKNFSGGITDFIFGDDVTTAEIVDNLEITKDAGLIGRWGSRPIDVNDSKPAVIDATPSHIVDFQDYKLIFHGGQILAYKDGDWILIGANRTSSKFLTEAINNSQISTFEWNKHLFVTDSHGSKLIKVFIDNNGVFQAATAGLPLMSSTPTVTPSANNGRSYIYSFMYKYEYQVGDVTHVDYGPVRETRIESASNFIGSTNNISNIPILVNTSKTHYDTSNIKIKIYRTVDGGTEGYLVGEIANGATSFIDNVSDEDLVLNELLYISSDTPDNDEPPVAKYIDISNNAAWYANIKGYPYRVIQSQLSDPDSVPGSYYMDFEEEVKGISSFQSNPIVFTNNQLWRIEGVIELDGSGVQRKVMVADSIGLLNHSSITKTDKGIFFAGVDSFYWTDGYTTKKIPGDNKNFPSRYSLISLYPNSIKGSFNRQTNKIYWTARGVDGYFIYCYDLTFNSFTTWSGRDGSFSPTAILCSKDRKIYRADISGYVMVHQSDYYSDPIIEVGKLPSTWQMFPVISNFKHIAFSFGQSDLNKWVTKLSISGDGKTNLDLGVMSYDNSGENPKTLYPISHSAGLIWGDASWTWGNPNSIWGVEFRLDQTRYFKSGKIRCKRKQISIFSNTKKISESFSDLPGSRVVVNAISKTATIINPDLVYIPQSTIGMNLVIDGKKYEIIESNLDTFRVIDVTNSLTSGTFDWYIEGYPHDQRFSLTSIIYNYELMHDNGGYFQKGVTISES